MELWQQCVDLLRDELPAQQFNTWIRPLQIEAEGDELRVYAPNRFVLDWVNEKYLSRLLELLGERSSGMPPALSLLIGSKRSATARAATPAAPVNSVASANVAPTPSNAAPAPVASNEPSRVSFDPMSGANAPVQAPRTERSVQV
ncbi:MAG: chromosomal replication initiator protein DnaA, partial [Pseudomonas sp.]|nr:chromosomal replication initiator protein DnaA [Pseudomonas sp.]